jgi:hypothetical protein
MGLSLWLPPGIHYIDYEAIDHPKNSFIFINTNQVHYFCTNADNEGVLIHFNDFSSIQFRTGTTIFPFDLQRNWATLYYRAKFEVDRINAPSSIPRRRKSTNGPCAKEYYFSC